MSGTLPNNSFLRVLVRENTPTTTTVAVSGVTQRKQIMTHYFEFELDYPTLTRQESKEIMGFLNKQRNSLYDFTMTLPAIGTTDGTVKTVIADNPATDDTMETTTSYSVGDSTIAFDTDFNSSLFTSSSVSASEGLVAGDFIKFAGHDKVYKVTDDVTFNATGGGTISIFPNLVSAVSSAEEIIYQDVPFKMFSTDVTQEVAYGLSETASIKLKLRESL